MSFSLLLYVIYSLFFFYVSFFSKFSFFFLFCSKVLLMLLLVFWAFSMPFQLLLRLLGAEVWWHSKDWTAVALGEKTIDLEVSLLLKRPGLRVVEGFFDSFWGENYGNRSQEPRKIMEKQGFRALHWGQARMSRRWFTSWSPRAVGDTLPAASCLQRMSVCKAWGVGELWFMGGKG